MLTIVNEITNFIKTIVFGKNYMQFYWMSSYMKFNSCGGVKTSWCFLKNYSMISITDVLQVGFLSSLTIVSGMTNLIKTIVWKNDLSFSIFRRRFHNETIVFLKNENVNIPDYNVSKLRDIISKKWLIRFPYRYVYRASSKQCMQSSG